MGMLTQLFLPHPFLLSEGREGICVESSRFGFSLYSTCSAGDPGSIPGSGRSPGERNGYSLQYSGLKNSMDNSMDYSMRSQRVDTTE